MINLILNICLFISLICLGIGYAMPYNNTKLLRVAGFILFGIYWFFQIPYFWSISDIVNLFFCAIALPFFGYIAYKQFIFYHAKKDIECLRFLSGWIFFAGFIYFSIEKIPSLDYGLRYITATQTVYLLHVLGINATQNDLWIHWSDVDVGIILACTAIQSILIFAGAFIAVKSTLKQKLYASSIVMPTIWCLNILRNASLIYIVGTTTISMEVAHNYIGKAGSLIALIILAFIVFRILPEIYHNLIELMDLPKLNPYLY